MKEEVENGGEDVSQLVCTRSGGPPGNAVWTWGFAGVDPPPQGFVYLTWCDNRCVRAYGLGVSVLCEGGGGIKASVESIEVVWEVVSGSDSGGA